MDYVKMTDEQFESLHALAMHDLAIRCEMQTAGFFRSFALRRALRENAAKRLDILNGAA